MRLIQHRLFSKMIVKNIIITFFFLISFSLSNRKQRIAIKLFLEAYQLPHGCGIRFKFDYQKCVMQTANWINLHIQQSHANLLRGCNSLLQNRSTQNKLCVRCIYIKYALASSYTIRVCNEALFLDFFFLIGTWGSVFFFFNRNMGQFCLCRGGSGKFYRKWFSFINIGRFLFLIFVNLQF